MPVKSSTLERRQFSRCLWPATLGVELIQPQRMVPADRVNLSEGGLCLRLPTMLEVRSLVRLNVKPGQSAARFSRSMECTGRVAWVTQRLDLRNVPPYLFDIGIELVNPPRFLSRWLAERAKSSPLVKARSPAANKTLETALIKGRYFVPHLDSNGPKPLRWHLVVTVDEMPCFSQRFASDRAAFQGWMQFKRRQAKSRGAKG